jgi:hypothetical protein
MFGFGTMTYLIKEARNAMGDNDIPVWSNNEVVSFTTKITELETTISEQSTEIANLQLELELTQDTNLDNVLQTLSSEGGGDTGDGSGGKKGGLMKKINSRRTTKHPPIRKYKSGGSVKKSTSKDEEHIHTYTVDNNMNGWTDMAFHPTESNIRHRHRIVNGKIMTAQSGCYPDCNKIYGVDGVPPHTHNL